MLTPSLLVSTRRSFLNRIGLVGLASSLPIGHILRFPGKAVFASAQEPLLTASAFKDRAPLISSAFYSLPLGSIRPRGWLKDQLEIQANGLSGHLDETWPDVGPNSSWLGGTG
ncbi:MAG: hypothetical protein P4L50_13980, partial [Anaerolineaceae bacterium]|nr:hypothetical protein [Anaerolineaceae bacterium]